MARGDADAALRSVCDQLRNVGYDPPQEHGAFSDTSPSVGVFIVPNCVETGANETLCRQAQSGDNIAGCVEEYIRCLDDKGVRQSSNCDKTLTHAYRAATPNPMARVGEGALQGVWNFISPSFSDLAGFLHNLSSRGTL